MNEVSHKLLIYHEGLRALKKRLDIIHQIHLAPEIYMTAVGEVVRRKSFSKAFLRVICLFCFVKYNKFYTFSILVGPRIVESIARNT